MMKKKKGGAAS